MENERVMNRGLVVVGAILIQLCLGAIYAWSVFTPAMKAESPSQIAEVYAPAPKDGVELGAARQLGLDEAATRQLVDELAEPRSQIRALTAGIKSETDQQKKEELKAEKKKATEQMDEIVRRQVAAEHLEKLAYGFTSTQTQVVFSVGLAAFAVAMVLAGRAMPKLGPRRLAVAGGVVLGLGYVLGGLLGGKSFLLLLLFIGLIGGVGIGLAYVVPIAVGIKWFPDKKGMITGLAVAGFGFGALIWIKLAGSWGDLIRVYSISNVFTCYGIVFFVLVLIGSIWMVNPPEGWKPAGWSPETAKGTAAAGAGIQFEPRQMLAAPQFYMLWIMFIFGAMAGLMTIGIIKLFGIDALQARAGMTFEQASATAGTAMAVFYAICNGLGRIVWGSVSDWIGRKASLTLMMGIQGIVMLAFFWMGGMPALLYLGAALIGFNFGGNFALFPAATADFFGNKNVGRNYGWMFTAYGVGGIVGPIMAGKLKDMGADKGVDAWLPAFIVCGVACLVAAVLGMMLKAPKATAQT